MWYDAVMTTMLKTEIRTLVRESVREAITAEMARVRASFFPFVSKKEQKGIEKLYKKPTSRSDRTFRVSL